jgi:ATP-dependent Clp protease ATP-binding subunit ClpC
MFERYTEKARRVMFFARFEACQFGAPQIEPEHLLLGLIREDKKLTERFFHRAGANVESIRSEIENRTAARERASTQGDLPLSEETIRALKFAAEESETLGNHHIGTEHLLLGLLREENSIAAEVLYARGLGLSGVRKDFMQRANLGQAPADRDAQWTRELSKACVEAGLFTQGEMVTEFTSVAALRQFEADTEALLRMLAAKGLADPQRLPNLAFDLRDETKLAEFIEKLRRL